MPVLGPTDPLPQRPARVVVVGTSGSGKSTLAGRIGRELGLAYTEMDSLYHGRGWTPRPSFLDDVAALVERERWVCEYQYDAARPLLASRADLAVWLDLPRHVVMRRVTRRTVARRLRREELWHGNREGPLRHILHDRDHIIRWAWKTHGRSHRQVAELLARRPDLTVVRLRSAREIQAWLRGPLAAAR